METLQKRKTVCFTGHRDLTEREKIRLKSRLQQVLKHCREEGVTCFRCGGALGFDTLAALAVLDLKRQYEEVSLELVLPCPEQPNRWNLKDVAVYRDILQKADKVTYVSDCYYNGVLQLRNRVLVEGADLCIAFLRSSTGGGTAYTVSYALSCGLDFINLFPE